MTLKTPRQRRVMRKAIKMARAGQRERAYERYDCAATAKSEARETQGFRAALTRERRAFALMFAVENVTLTPPEKMRLLALRRAGRRLNTRHA